MRPNGTSPKTPKLRLISNHHFDPNFIQTYLAMLQQNTSFTKFTNNMDPKPQSPKAGSSLLINKFSFTS